jgi:hypothetical protein
MPVDGSAHARMMHLRSACAVVKGRDAGARQLSISPSYPKVPKISLRCSPPTLRVRFCTVSRAALTLGGVSSRLRGTSLSLVSFAGDRDRDLWPFAAGERERDFFFASVPERVLDFERERDGILRGTRPFNNRLITGLTRIVRQHKGAESAIARAPSGSRGQDSIRIRTPFRPLPSTSAPATVPCARPRAPIVRVCAQWPERVGQETYTGRHVAPRTATAIAPLRSSGHSLPAGEALTALP